MKRKLLFAVMTLITGAWSLSANAQEDITSTYLTNANLATVGSGWTQNGYTAWNTGAAVPVVEFWNWTNQFNFSQTITLPAGNYRIAVNAFYRESWGGNGTNNNMAWIFAGSKTQNVIPLNSMNDLSGYAGGNDLERAATAFSQGKFSNAFDFDLTEETSIELGFRGTCPNGGWCILGPVKLYKYSLEDYLVDYRALIAQAQAILDSGSQMDASVQTDLQNAMVDESEFSLVSEVLAATSTLQAAIDAANASIAKYETIAANEAAVAGASVTNPITTNFIVNGTFDSETSPWQTTTGAQNQGVANNQSGAFTGNYWENWNPSAFSGKMYQVVENIPNGVYELQMAAFVNNLDGTQQYIYANDEKTYLTTGEPTLYKVFVEVTDNTVEVGFQTSGANWCGIDNAVLIYYGADASIDDIKNASYIATVADLKAQIRAITAVPTAYASADETTLNSIADTYSTTAEYEAAIAQLNSILSARQAMETAFAEYLAVKANADALVAAPNDNAEANSTLATAISTAETSANAAGSSADLAPVISDLKDAMATYCNTANPTDANQPFDMTFMLTNPELSAFAAWQGGIPGWYTDQADGNFQAMVNGEMGPGDEHFMEYWTATPKTSGFVLYQKITLPEGTYKMTGRVGLLQNVDGTTANMTFSANETDGTQIAVGPLSDQSVEFINTTSQEVKIGIKAHTGNCYRWIGMNDIHLYKVPTVDTEYAIAVNAGDGATVTVTVNGVEVNAAKKLDPVTVTVGLESEYAVSEVKIEYTDADNNIQTITPTVVTEGSVYTFQMPEYDVTISVETVNPALEAAYVAYLELKDYADVLVAVDNDNAAANQDLAAAITTAETDIQAATTAVAAEAVNAALKAAMIQYATVATPTEGNKFDLTFMVTNPDVTNLWTGAWNVTPAGWGTEQTGGNFQVMSNDDVIADAEHTTFVEYYYLEGGQTWGNGQFNVYTSIEDLPAGTFEMSCYAFAKEQNYSSGAANPQVYFYANDTKGSNVNSSTLTEQSITFVNASEQDVKVGLKPEAGNTYNWMGIGYVQLFKVPAGNFEVGDDTWDPTTSGAGDVTLNRAINVGWNAYVLPFAISQAEVETYFGEGSVVKLVNEFDAAEEHLSFTTSETGVSANVPCLIKATQSAASGTVTFPERSIVPATSLTANGEALYEGTEVAMYGCYADETTIPENALFVQDAKLKWNNVAIEPAYIYSTRAYIVLNGWTPGAAGIKGLTIDFGDGEATGIATLADGQLNILTGKAYDLSGREVKNPTKGLYIIDGKKVLLK